MSMQTPDCGAPGARTRDRRGRLRQPAWVDGRAGTPGAGGMDLEASLLPTGPNASNTSESPDNLTSAGEMRWRAGLPPLRR